jgi:hypothetical protein
VGVVAPTKLAQYFKGHHIHTQRDSINRLFTKPFRLSAAGIFIETDSFHEYKNCFLSFSVTLPFELINLADIKTKVLGAW